MGVTTRSEVDLALNMKYRPRLIWRQGENDNERIIKTGVAF